MRNTTSLLAVTAAALLALTGCSSSDDTASTDPTTAAPSAPADAPSTSATPADDDALTTAVQAYTTAYFAGDGDTAYAALSKRCQGKIDAATYGAVVKQAHTDYGTGHPATGVQADVSGELARVSYKVKGLPKFDQTGQPWTREGGTWKYDAC